MAGVGVSGSAENVRTDLNLILSKEAVRNLNLNYEMRPGQPFLGPGAACRKLLMLIGIASDDGLRNSPHHDLPWRTS